MPIVLKTTVTTLSQCCCLSHYSKVTANACCIIVKLTKMNSFNIMLYV